MIVTEINKMALQCKNLTPVSCPAEAVQILLKSLEECNYDATRFSLLAVIFRTTLNKITSRRFQQHLQKARLCSVIRLHLFIFTYSPAFATP